MDNSVPPPAYSPPGSADEAPPPFEPGPSAPVISIDSKPLDDHSASGVPIPPPPRRNRPPTASSSNPQSLPPTFIINQRTIGPFDLITLDEIKAHLVLLGAFARLEARVKSQKDVDFRGSTDELWAIYVARAVDRFAAWVSKGLPNDLDTSHPRMLNEDEVPPLDVLMAWHAYMLNPRVYYEDGVTRKSQVLGILAFPLNHIKKIINVDKLVAVHPSRDRQQLFESLTGQPWLCPLTTTTTDTTFVPCPRCEQATLNEVPWITTDKTGFAENNFKARCHACTRVFNRNEMMIRGVCEDIVQVRYDLTQNTGNPENQKFLSGTLLDWKTGRPDYKKAAIGNRVLLKYFLNPYYMQFNRGDTLASSLNYSIKELETSLKEGLNLRSAGGLVTRVLSYYRCPYYPFSIELCGAILRQGRFINKMSTLGWTEPRTFDQDPTVITRCVSRYHAWLEDLAWHTHQLKQQDYRTWTLEVLGQFVDHDDKVEENKLSDAYDMTANYWEQRWGVPYHVCGCIHPQQDKPFNPSEKLSRMFRGKGKAPEFTNPRPDLVSTHDCEASTTHPSEHNSIVVVGQTLFQTRREERERKREKWAKQLRSDVDKGKVPPDGWEAMSLERATEHEQGFSRTMPDPNLAPVVPYGAETCAARHGGVLNGENLASTPMDGKHSAGVCAVGMGLYGMPPAAGLHVDFTETEPELFATVIGASVYL
ncbi:unnamed protein product [Rhizoctonia solani]|uniref:Uncharacterized protein n=1 Tax=Rhizoctonia solani TaxID=456999 RepID=A0A8H3CFR6_9AGAM|nr:unnamed protein product [Rhizoctonia solani]